jgi:hypothetical protein
MRSKKLPQSDIKSVFGQLSTPDLRYSKIVGAWRSAGYPEDTASLTAMLRKLGYSNKQINDAFRESAVATPTDDYGASSNRRAKDTAKAAAKANALIVTLYHHIIDNGLRDEVMQRMADEYGFGAQAAPRGSAFQRFKRLFSRLSEELLDDEYMQPHSRKEQPPAEDGDTLTESQYNTLLQELDRRIMNRLNARRIKRRIVNAWKRGMHKRTHFDNILRSVDLSLNNLV